MAKDPTDSLPPVEFRKLKTDELIYAALMTAKIARERDGLLGLPTLIEQLVERIRDLEDQKAM